MGVIAAAPKERGNKKKENEAKNGHGILGDLF